MSASSILMIRPCNFGYNPETAATNFFQKQIALAPDKIQSRALNEFENFVKLLRKHKITVEIFDDSPLPLTPDSIFPNNWFSVHDGLLIIYPMLTPNRRNEKRKDIINFLLNKYSIARTIDFSHYEAENKFLEGTGSLVFDRKNNFAYAGISSRTDKEIAEKVCNLLGYSLVVFSSANEIYHTNVIMSVGDGFSIVCLDACKNNSEKKLLKRSLEKSGEIVEISITQMNSFCGNTLPLRSSEGQKILVMSENAFRAFRKDQLDTLESYAEIIYSSLNTIETAGGGSARCMMAEIGSLAGG